MLKQAKPRLGSASNSLEHRRVRMPRLPPSQDLEAKAWMSSKWPPLRSKEVRPTSKSWFGLFPHGLQNVVDGCVATHAATGGPSTGGWTRWLGTHLVPLRSGGHGRHPRRICHIIYDIWCHVYTKTSSTLYLVNKSHISHMIFIPKLLWNMDYLPIPRFRKSWALSGL